MALNLEHFDIDSEVDSIVFGIMAARGMIDNEIIDFGETDEDELIVEAEFEQYNEEREEQGLEPVTLDEFKREKGYIINEIEDYEGPIDEYAEDEEWLDDEEWDESDAELFEFEEEELEEETDEEQWNDMDVAEDEDDWTDEDYESASEFDIDSTENK